MTDPGDREYPIVCLRCGAPKAADESYVCGVCVDMWPEWKAATDRWDADHPVPGEDLRAALAASQAETAALKETLALVRSNEECNLRLSVERADECDRLAASLERARDLLERAADLAGDHNSDLLLDDIVAFLRPPTPIATPGAPTANPMTYAEEPGRDYRKERDVAYTERNRLVAALARLIAAGPERSGQLGVWLADHKDEPGVDWDPEWRTIVFIDGPTGQLSWHLHDSDVPLFDGLERGPNLWDGHTTEEKYERVARLGRATIPVYGTAKETP